MFILLSSFIITIHTKTTRAKRSLKALNKKLSRSKQFVAGPLANLKKNNVFLSGPLANLKNKDFVAGPLANLKNKDFDMAKALNIFDFIMGILNSLPVMEDFQEILLDLVEGTDTCNKVEIIKAYYEGIKFRKEASFKSSLPTLEQMEIVKSKLPWKPTEESEILKKNLGLINPEEACEAIIKEKQRQISDNNKFIDAYKGALNAALEIQKNNMSVDEFVKKIPYAFFSIFNSETNDNYVNLEQFIMRTLFANLNLKSITEFQLMVNNGKIDWREVINNAVSFLNDNKNMAMMNLRELGFSGNEDPDCSKLPGNVLMELYKNTVMDIFAGGWSALKYVGKCLIDKLINVAQEKLKENLIDLIKGLGIGFLKKLLVIFATTAANMFTLFSAKAVKVLWWLTKAGYYINKAINEEKNSYRLWGKAVGAGIRVIYIAFMPTERKK